MAKKVLIVDDSEIVLEAARGALEHAGFEVFVANDLSQLAGYRGGADLLLMDVQMPEAYGDEVAQVLRDVRGVSVPIWLFSSLDDAELARRVSEAGLDGWISKRAGVEAMVDQVRAILGVSP